MNIIELDKNVTSFLEDLHRVNLSPNYSGITFVGKAVWEENGKIYRVSDLNDAQRRIGICAYFEKLGFPIFQKEKVLLKREWITLTSQEKLAPVEIPESVEGRTDLFFNQSDKNDTEKFLAEYFFGLFGEERYKILQKEFNDLEIMWVHKDNIGMSGDQIKIFDYVADVAINTTHVFCRRTKNLVSLEEIGMQRPSLS